MGPFVGADEAAIKLLNLIDAKLNVPSTLRPNNFNDVPETAAQ